MMRNNTVKSCLVILVIACVFLPGKVFAASIFEQAETEYYQRNYDAAIEDYKRCMQQEQEHAADAATKLFSLYKFLHRYNEAAQQLSDIERLTGRTYALTLAELYQTAGNHYEAQRLYEEYLAKHPDNEAAMFGLAQSLEATGNYDAARDYYNRIVNLNGEFASYARRHMTRIKDASASVKIDNDSEIGRWSAASMPIKVFIEDSQLTGYKPQLRVFVSRAIVEWNQAAHGLLEMVQTSDKDKANIVVSWVSSLRGALGVARPETEEHTIQQVHVELAVDVDARGASLPEESPATAQLYQSRDKMVQEVALHELGHALGLNHSTRTDDIMADGIFGLNSSDVLSARGLQQGDIDRLHALYSEGEGAQANAETPQASANATKSGAKTVWKIVPVNKPAPVVSVPSAQAGGDPVLSEAMGDLSAGRFDACRDALTTVLNRDPRNVKAHYLMAITLVNLRQYKAAAEHYRQVMTLAPAGPLAKRASEGLSKINH